MAVKKRSPQKKSLWKVVVKRWTNQSLTKYSRVTPPFFPTISHETIRKMNGFILILILLFYTADVAYSEGNL